MANIFDVETKCAQCQGTGLWDLDLDGSPSGSIRCPMCHGTGKMKIGEVDLSDVVDKIGDVMDKCEDILEKLNE